MKNNSRKIKNALITLGVPVVTYLIFLLTTNIFGITGFGVGPDLNVIIYNTCYSGFIALAMSFNLTSGRFDFAIGSVLILSLIVGGNIALAIDAGPYLMLLLVLIVGVICGAISGLVYTTLKLPPMVSSLAMAMIYEAIAFMINDSQGLVMIGKFDLLIFAANPTNIIFVAIVVAVLSYLLEYTKFGYDTKSLKTGQKNAVDVGINEKRNSVFCYMIAGGLMACAGVLYISQYGVLKPVVGLASSSFMMSAFLPMFIGNVLEKHSNRNIGVICGAFMQACLSSALVKFGASSSLSLVVNGACVLLLLIYVSNIYKVGILKRNKAIKAKALASKV